MGGEVVAPHPPICVILNTGTSPLHRFPRRKGSPVDLSSYADLAVRLVNTESLGHEGGDQLTTLDGLRALVADREHLNHGISRADLEALRQLRTEFRAFFVACSRGDGADAAARLNELLIQYPVHPQLSGHDRQAWHVHYTESGSMSDKYAAGAAMGLAVRLTELGLDRFGLCQAAPCQGVFIDTTSEGSRRYCSERCANRANLTAFLARKQAEESQA
jgi:predicted RNA-binding Zn ribbon-like protein